MFGANSKNTPQILMNPKLHMPVNFDRMNSHSNSRVIKHVTVNTSNNSNLPQVSKDLHSMLESEKFSDCVLVVEKKELHAHKVILAARSPVFSAMFEHDCEEKRKSRVQITDVHLDVFEELLKYVYSGKVNDLDKYAGELLEAADKYQMDCLKQICEQYLHTNMNNESVANILVLADMRSMSELKQKCIKHITGNANEVMATESWKLLVEKRPDLLAPLFAELASKKPALNKPVEVHGGIPYSSLVNPYRVRNIEN